MKLIKFLLFLVAIGLGVWIFFWLLGVVSVILWYALWIGLLALGGYAGYKLFLEKDREKPQLAEKTPVGIAEMQNADRVLDEYRSKYLPENKNE